MPPAPPAALAAALRGRYTLERELGRGGMATVWLAEDLRHHRPVAIKVLHPELAPLLGADRFAREIRTVAALSHPHILPLYDSGEAPAGLRYFVMPWVRGESLRARLAREGRLPVEEAVGIARDAAAALHYAHERGLVHRDVKPENILLHEGEAMVADFGVALAADAAPGERLTAAGFMVGTPEYMSPEQAVGERALDARSDVYGLACVLYELLAGAPPFSGGSAMALAAKRFTEPVPRIRRVRPEVPPAVEAALVRALAVEPAERFPTAAAFAEALAAALGATPPAPIAAAAPPALPALPAPSVAVLPFLNLSADPDNEFFADGITEDVIAQLSKIRALKVISRTSVMPFKGRERTLREIGAMLGVATLLEGSVRRAGSRVRIVAQLIDADSDRHLWAETYDRELTDIFAIQSDVALNIAAALEAELTHDERRRIRREPTKDLQAYQLYLQGKHCLARSTEEGMRQALDYFAQALARDPDYALAHATTGYVYSEIASGVAGALPPAEAYRQAEAAATRALAIDPGLAEAHAVMGFLHFARDYDWDAAERAFCRALELNPNSGDVLDYYGRMLTALERYDEALAVQRRAHELDPLAHRVDIATTLLRAGRHAEAVVVATEVLEVEPYLALAHATLGWAHLLSGGAAEGLAALERAVALAPESTMYLAQLGQAYARVGRAADARAVLARLEAMAGERYVSPYHLAYVFTGLGDFDRAMDWLERAHAERAGGIYGVKGSFLFSALRGQPRFEALVAKMNLA
ncbi:MAG TPA: protein kinase [Gemmatimonadales bacterium]|nr:protein kinase [Gemmatimonadales bacterium]